MRYWLLALLMVFCAVVWYGCSDPVKVASREIDRVTRITQTTEAAYKRQTKDRLTTIATEEKDKRTTALKSAGCPTDAEPALTSSDNPCKKIWTDSRASYEGRKVKVVEIATKLDASTGLVYATLLAAVDALTLLKDKVGSIPALQALVAKAATMLTDFLTIYQTFQTNLGKL